MPEDELRSLIEPLVRVHGLELVDVQWVTAVSGRILRVSIERPLAAPDAEEQTPGNVTIDDCARVSRDLSTVLDVNDSLEQRYSLEVSSPGLDRPLRTASDYQRQLGKLAKVWLNEPAADGQMVLRGPLLTSGEDYFTIDVDGNEHRVELANVKRAKLVFEIGKSTKGGHDRKRAKRNMRRKAGAKRRQ